MDIDKERADLARMVIQDTNDTLAEQARTMLKQRQRIQELEAALASQDTAPVGKVASEQNFMTGLISHYVQWTDNVPPVGTSIYTAPPAAVPATQEPLSKKLWRDLKTDAERSNWLLLGRGHETGVVAASIQNELAMAYHRLANAGQAITREQIWDAFSSIPDIPDGLYAQVKHFLKNCKAPSWLIQAVDSAS